MADEETREETKDKKPEATPIGMRLFKSRQIRLFGPVDSKLAARVIGELLALEEDDPEAPITLLINSPGGSVTDGFAIYDTMRFIRPEVRVVCMGLAASAATVILLGAPKQWRTALPNTKLLIHQVYIPGAVRGQATDLEITARDMIRTRDHLNKLLADETGQDLAQVERDTNRDYWMTAEEAVEYGLIARTVASRTDLD